MNELVFSLHDNSGDESELNQTTTVVFNVPEGMHINTLHRLCKSFALALGYTEQTVENCFGETMWED